MAAPEYLPCELLALKKQLRLAEQPQRNRVYLVTAVLPTPRHRPVNERDGWWSLDDPDEYDFMTCRWPVLTGGVRGPPSADIARESA